MSNLNTRPRAFTIVELLVVMAIIFVLLSITVVGFNFRDTLDGQHKTLIAMDAAKMIATEYAGLTEGYVIKVGETGDPPPGLFFSNETYSGNNSIEQFVSAVRGIPECLELLQKLPIERTLPDEDDLPTTILDGWGTPLKYAAWVTDDQSTLPRHNTPFFASAGPDKLWGDPSSADPDLLAESEDNLYSFEQYK